MKIDYTKHKYPPGLYVTYAQGRPGEKFTVTERKYFVDIHAFIDVGPYWGYMDSYEIRFIQGILILISEFDYMLFQLVKP